MPHALLLLFPWQLNLVLLRELGSIWRSDGGKEPTMAELRKMSDEAAWAWCVKYFRTQVTMARSQSRRNKFVFPVYKDGI